MGFPRLKHEFRNPVRSHVSLPLIPLTFQATEKEATKCSVEELLLVPQLVSASLTCLPLPAGSSEFAHPLLSGLRPRFWAKPAANNATHLSADGKERELPLWRRALYLFNSGGLFPAHLFLLSLLATAHGAANHNQGWLAGAEHRRRGLLQCTDRQ